MILKESYDNKTIKFKSLIPYKVVEGVLNNALVILKHSGKYPEYRTIAHRPLSEYVFEKEDRSVQEVFWTFISEDVSILVTFSSMNKALRREFNNIQLKVLKKESTL